MIDNLPLALEDAHHISIKSRCVAWPKRHHTEAPLFIVWRKEGEFLLITVMDCDLVIPSFVVEGNEVLTPS